jgi:hypothetical protein
VAEEAVALVTDAQESPRTLEQLAAEHTLANRAQLTAIILRMQADALEGHARELREIARALEGGGAPPPAGPPPPGLGISETGKRR